MVSSTAKLKSAQQILAPYPVPSNFQIPPSSQEFRAWQSISEVGRWKADGAPAGGQERRGTVQPAGRACTLHPRPQENHAPAGTSSRDKGSEDWNSL